MMIGEMIKAARRARDLTQDEFASQLGINRATLSKYESNTIEPSSSMIIRIAKELNIPVSFLFGESTGQILSSDFQSEVLATVQERLSFLLSTFDPEDLFAAYGTYDIFEVYSDIFEPRAPITIERLDSIATEQNVSREYLLGVVEEPSDTLDNVEDRKLLWKMIDTFSILNDEGRVKAVERIEELAEISRYRKQKTPPQDPEDPETE